MFKRFSSNKAILTPVLLIALLLSPGCSPVAEVVAVSAVMGGVILGYSYLHKKDYDTNYNILAESPSDITIESRNPSLAARVAESHCRKTNRPHEHISSVGDIHKYSCSQHIPDETQ